MRNQKKNLDTNKNGNTKYQNLWNAAKAVIRQRFTTINDKNQKVRKSQIRMLTLELKELE